MAASIIAGMLWDAIGPKATFLAGACFTAAALVGPHPRPPAQERGERLTSL
jgi:hypothetical protein